MENIEKRGIQVLYAHRATDLIQDPETQEIRGVTGEHAGQGFSVRALKAVVLSTGGFEWDEEMKMKPCGPIT
jgi:succinate dehydrogenase/fumarate reductase flavoprotein subunit